MLDSEVRQLELLSSLDSLRHEVDAWVRQPTDWQPVLRCQQLLARLLGRLESLRVRMEAPLVVATFGGTGTGKSSLVNALVGEEVTRAGRQRPTTRRPVLIVHPQADLQQLGIPLDDVDVVQRDADLLRDVVILDCPDPDTTEGDAPGSNLDRLRTLLPWCDVLLCVSTQQKYRSARVADELSAAAAGCRMIFVQTHADLDDDIRHDWQRTLGDEYEVPEVFFVDSLRALKEQQSGQRPTGDMRRLIDLLLNKLGASERVRVRRANVLDLLQASLFRCQEILQEQRPRLDELSAAMNARQADLSRRMAQRLQQELLASQSLWERRLLGEVNDRWGMSPFSWVLRAWHGLGSLLASTLLFRARSAAQLALLGTVQGMRWLEGRRKEQQAESSLSRVSHFGLDDALLRESEIIMDGYVTAAGLSGELLQPRSLDELRKQAADVEERFIGDASSGIDEIISELARKNSQPAVRVLYEVLFGAYVVFILYRVGRNFFYDSFIRDQPFLSGDFYLAAGLFLLLWSGLLVILFTRRLRRGLRDRIGELAGRMVEFRLGSGLYPELERAVQRSRRQSDELTRLLAQTAQLRQQIAGIEHFASRSVPRRPAVPLGE